MFDLSGGMFWLAVTAGLVIVGVGLVMLHGHVQHQRRNKQIIEARFRLAMQQHSRPDVQILRDVTQLGGRGKTGKYLFYVNRVLHHPPDRWFVYTHIEDSEPMLLPVSEQRAMAVMQQ